MHSFPIPIVHRDLKSSNILITEEQVGKISDCGESRRVSLDSTMTHVGTPLYAAPEILQALRYDERVDVYSFGVIISEVKSRAKPFAEIPIGEKRGFNSKLSRDLCSGKRRVRNDEEWGDEIHDLIDRCTRLSPGERASFADVAETLRILHDEATGKKTRGSGKRLRRAKGGKRVHSEKSGKRQRSDKRSKKRKRRKEEGKEKVQPEKPNADAEQGKEGQVQPGEAESQQRDVVSESNGSGGQIVEAIEEVGQLDRDGEDLEKDGKLVAEQKEQSTEVGAEGENGAEERQEGGKEENGAEGRQEGGKEEKEPACP